MIIGSAGDRILIAEDGLGAFVAIEFDVGLDEYGKVHAWRTSGVVTGRLLLAPPAEDGWSAPTIVEEASESGALVTVAADRVRFSSLAGGGLVVETAEGGNVYEMPRVFFRQTLTASAPSISFDVPETATNVRLIVQARGTSSNNVDTLLLRFNGDSGSNYHDERIVGVGTTPSASANVGATAMAIGAVTAGGATGGAASPSHIEIPNARGAVFHKSAVGYSGASAGVAANHFAGVWSGRWANDDPVTSITLLPSVNDFAAGTHVTAISE